MSRIARMLGNDEIRMSNAERTTRFLNQEIRNPGNRISEMEGKAASVAAAESDYERVSIEEMGFPR
jgi:hypothetical protein